MESKKSVTDTHPTAIHSSEVLKTTMTDTAKDTTHVTTTSVTTTDTGATFDLEGSAKIIDNVSVHINAIAEVLGVDLANSNKVSAPPAGYRSYIPDVARTGAIAMKQAPDIYGTLLFSPDQLYNGGNGIVAMTIAQKKVDELSSAVGYHLNMLKGTVASQTTDLVNATKFTGDSLLTPAPVRTRIAAVAGPMLSILADANKNVQTTRGKNAGLRTTNIDPLIEAEATVERLTQENAVLRGGEISATPISAPKKRTRTPAKGTGGTPPKPRKKRSGGKKPGGSPTPTVIQGRTTPR